MSDILYRLDDGDPVSPIHTWAVIIAGIFVLVAVSLSSFLIFDHLTSYKKPEEQKWLLGVIFMVPFYSVESLVSLWNPTISLACGILRDCYEAFAMYCFISYLIACLGGEERVVNMLERQAVSGPRTPLLTRTRSLKRAAVKHPLPFNWCLSPWVLGKSFYDIVKFGIVQYMIVKTFLSFLALFLNLFDAYGDGEFKWNLGYPYMTIILNFSQTWALYCLVQFYAITKDELHEIKPLPKFISFKAIVFATWWQGVCIAVLFGSGAINVSSIEGMKLQASLQDFIICIEMAIAAVAHMYIFPARPYQLLFEPGYGRVSVLSDYASIDSPLDPDEIKESERRAILRHHIPNVGTIHTSVKQSFQDVVFSGGEQVVNDVKLTVHQAVEPIEKGITRINEHLQRNKEKKRSKDDSCIASSVREKPPISASRGIKGIDDPLWPGSISDSGVIRSKKSYVSGAESSGESSDQGLGGFKTSGKRWTVKR